MWVPEGRGQGVRDLDTLQRAGAELGRARLMLVGAAGGSQCSETPRFAGVWWGASQMPPATSLLFLPAWRYPKAAMAIFSASLKPFFFEDLMVNTHKTL